MTAVCGVAFLVAGCYVILKEVAGSMKDRSHPCDRMEGGGEAGGCLESSGWGDSKWAPNTTVATTAERIQGWLEDGGASEDTPTSHSTVVVIEPTQPGREGTEPPVVERG